LHLAKRRVDVLRVIVVGGGIGGMAAAVALERAGCDPLVLERADELREVGAGLNVAANAVKALRHLGLEDVLRARGTESKGALIASLETNEQIVFAEEEEHFQIHRADLLAGLRGALAPDRVRLDSEVAAIEQDAGGVSVTLVDGETVTGDVLIGADGIHSVTRDALVGPHEPRFTGYVAWRAVFPSARLPHYAVQRNWGWAGPGRSAFFYPVRSYELLAFVANVPAAEVTRESWSLSGDVDELRRSLAGSCEQVLEIVDAIDEAFLTGLYFRDPLPAWSVGRATLLGDAAHAAGPFLGQGAAMALEDAVTLAACVGRRPDDVPAALAEYEARRRPRTSRFQVTVRLFQEFLHEREPARIAARAMRARGAQRLDPLWGGGSAFIVRHDPVVALGSPVEELNRAAGVPTWQPSRPQARRAFGLWAEALDAEDRALDWPGERDGYERFLARISPAAADLAVTELELGGVAALEIVPPGGEQGPLVLHLHGGGYVLGSARSSVGLAGRLARALGGVAVTVDYRRSPEHAAGAAVEDALSAYAALAERYPGRRIVLSGEDAGAGLALAAAVELGERAIPAPAMLYLLSPFCDLALTSPSIDANGSRDPWLSRDLLVVFAGSYIQAQDPTSAEVSPINADLRGLPPMLIHAAADEVLADDATRLARRAADQGVEVSVRLFDDTVHAFALFDFLPETDEALADLAAFSTSHVSAASTTEGRSR
jgi:salicylate hydroxylase